MKRFFSWQIRLCCWLGLISTATLLGACVSLPGSRRAHNIKLYSRGIEHRELGKLRLRYTYDGPESAKNYFYAEFSSSPRPIEKIQIPGQKNVRPQRDAEAPGHLPGSGRSYLKIQTIIPETWFKGSSIFRYRTRQPFSHEDGRLVERILLISDPDSSDNILSLDFYLFPSRRGYLLRLDLRPAADFYRRVPAGTPPNQVAKILGDNEAPALFHNQTIVGKAQYY